MVSSTSRRPAKATPLLSRSTAGRCLKSGCGGDKCIIVSGIVDPCVKSTGQTLWLFLNSFGKAPLYADINGDVSGYTTVVGDALALVVKQTCDKIAIR